MGCTYTCCKIPCGCCALGFGWPLYQCICPSNRVSDGDSSKSKIKPPASALDASNAEFCGLRQSAIDNKGFQTTINSWTSRSIDDLISLLLTYCANKHLIDQLWIIFYWISQNISYDADSYLNGRIPAQTASDIFQNRKAVCEGYASLFLHLCTSIGLDCVKISGYAKGHGYEARGSKFSEANHAWNAVAIGSSWYLVDSTWGAGSLDGKVFKKKLQPFYFLVRPEQFVYTHLPEDKNWQLLSKPLTMETFLSLPRPWPAFFEMNLELVDTNSTHTVHLKPNKSFAEVLVRCPPNVLLHTSIEQNGTKVNGGDLIQYDHEGDVYQCLFAPQQTGRHKLNIFAKKTGTAGSYDCAIEFSLDVPKSLNAITFPTTYGGFVEKKCYLYEPLTHVLQKGSTQTFHCHIPGAKRVALIADGKKWVYDDGYKDGTMKLTLTISEKSVTVNAQFENRTNFDTFVEYAVK